MKFKDLETKLNEIIQKEGAYKSSTFGSKSDLKDWLEDKIKEIVGTKYMAKDWEDKGKYRVNLTYSGNQNYIYISKSDYNVLRIDFKFTRESHSVHWWTETTYGIKSVDVGNCYDIDSDNFKDCVVEIENKKIEDANYRKEKRQEKHDKVKRFMKKHNTTLDDIFDIVEVLKSIDYNDEPDYDYEFNNGKSADWYKI